MTSIWPLNYTYCHEFMVVTTSDTKISRIGVSMTNSNGFCIWWCIYWHLFTITVNCNSFWNGSLIVIICFVHCYKRSSPLLGKRGPIVDCIISIMRLPKHCLTMDVCSGPTILAFSCHVIVINYNISIQHLILHRCRSGKGLERHTWILWYIEF